MARIRSAKVDEGHAHIMAAWERGFSKAVHAASRRKGTPGCQPENMMGLTKCVDCGAKMGDSAARCVQCGARPKPKTSITTKVIAGLFALVIAFSVLRPAQEPAAPAAKPQLDYPHAEIAPQARSLIREKSKDAGSLKFRNEFTAQPGVHCGEVNGKNSFGAYAGFVRFIAQGETLLMDDATSKHFADAWLEFCTPKKAT